MVVWTGRVSNSLLNDLSSGPVLPPGVLDWSGSGTALSPVIHYDLRKSVLYSNLLSKRGQDYAKDARSTTTLSRDLDSANERVNGKETRPPITLRIHHLLVPLEKADQNPFRAKSLDGVY